MLFRSVRTQCGIMYESYCAIAIVGTVTGLKKYSASDGTLFPISKAHPGILHPYSRAQHITITGFASLRWLASITGTWFNLPKLLESSVGDDQIIFPLGSDSFTKLPIPA